MQLPPTHSQRLLIDISWGALLKIAAFVFGVWSLFVLKDLLILLFIVFIFIGAVNPIVTDWQQRMPRSLAVALIYLILFLCVIVAALLIVPPLLAQISDVAKTLPEFVNRARIFFQTFETGRLAPVLDQAFNNISGSLSSFGVNLFNTTVSILGGLAAVITAIALSFYLLLEEDNAKTFFHQVLPHNRYEAIYTTVNKIAHRMGSWVQGQLVLMLIIGAANFLAFIILGVPTPLALAVWAGLAEVVPYIGPLIGVLPAIVVAAVTGSPLLVLLVVLINFLLIQQLEAHFIVPKVMGKAVGLSPVLVIIAIIVGAQLYGLLGALVAIPAAAAISVIVGEWPQLKLMWHNHPLEGEEGEREGA
jgi:predicted PurR-regulated permease PerM